MTHTVYHQFVYGKMWTTRCDPYCTTVPQPIPQQ